MDGNYGGSLDFRVRRANLIVFLDFPRRVTVPGVLRRRLRRKRPDEIPGCPERVTYEFLRWIWRFQRDDRPSLLAAVSAAGSNEHMIQLTSRREVVEWLRSPS